MQNQGRMKKCPFCAEEIQPGAAKCRHCGEWLDEGRAAAAPPPPGGMPAWAIVLIIVVVAIPVLCVLAGLMVPALMKSSARANMAAYEARVKADFKVIEDAIQFFRMDTQRYPENLEELMLGSDIEGWKGPYLKRPPEDPWGEMYIYEYTGEDPIPYEIKTFGADRQESGEGDDKDYSNLDFLEGKGF